MDWNKNTRHGHPAKHLHNRFIWNDHSDQPTEMQVIDLLHDIRFLLLLIFLVLAISL